MKKNIKENYIAITMFLIFETIAISLFISTKNIFYLFNFTYIGLCITIGLILTKRKNKYSRNFVQLGVGLYMFLYAEKTCK